VPVVVAQMAATITSWLVRGLPRRFMVMWENSRCSILFHLEVPRGKWHAVNLQAGLPGQRRELMFPGPGAVGDDDQRQADVVELLEDIQVGGGAVLRLVDHQFGA
jgi:hypothetical protein